MRRHKLNKQRTREAQHSISDATPIPLGEKALTLASLPSLPGTLVVRSQFFGARANPTFPNGMARLNRLRKEVATLCDWAVGLLRSGSIGRSPSSDII